MRGFPRLSLTTYKIDVDKRTNMYGLTQTDKFMVESKIRKQKEFLTYHIIKDKVTGNIFPLSNVIVSAYHSPQRYYGEIQNRVNTLVSIANKRDLQPIFMTITLPSAYHKKKIKNKQLVDNKNYKDKTVNESLKELTKRFSKLRHDRSLKELPKEKRIYFRAIEPHKNGTPHTHILIFIPKDRVDRLHEAFNRLYDEKVNDFQILDNESNAVSYIMKYINKTIPLSKKKDLTIKDKYLNAWYSHHRVSRFITSRTLAPLNIYRLVHKKFSLESLTNVYYKKDLQILTTLDTNKIMEIFFNNELIYLRNENYQVTTRKHDGS